ncbi:MAG: RDD family protein [Bdellovibrionota bacterium]
MAEEKWFVRYKGEEVGPYTTPQVRIRAEAGVLNRDTEVRKDGTARWVPLSATGILEGVAISALREAPSTASPRPAVPSARPVEPGRPAAAAPLPSVSPPAPVTAEAPAASQRRYAGFWIRVAAWLLDAVILGIPLAILFAVLGLGIGAFAAKLLNYFVGIFVTFWCLTQWGATPGMYFLGIILVRYPENGLCSWLQVIGRQLAMAGIMLGPGALILVFGLLVFDSDSLPAIVSLFFGLGMILGMEVLFAFSIASHPEKRGWHDRFAGTCVVHVR